VLDAPLPGGLPAIIDCRPAGAGHPGGVPPFWLQQSQGYYQTPPGVAQGASLDPVGEFPLPDYYDDEDYEEVAPRARDAQPVSSVSAHAPAAAAFPGPQHGYSYSSMPYCYERVRAIEKASRGIPVFSNQRGENLEDRLKDLWYVISELSLTPAETHKLLSKKTGGVVRKVVEGMSGPERSSFTAMATRLRQRFGAEKSRSSLEAKLADMTQGEHEKTRDYRERVFVIFHELADLIRGSTRDPTLLEQRLQDLEKRAIRDFRRGLLPHLHAAMGPVRTRSLEHAAEVAIQHEKHYNATQGNIRRRDAALVHAVYDGGRGGNYNGRQPSDGNRGPRDGNRGGGQVRANRYIPPPPFPPPIPQPIRKCYVCGTDQHYATVCPERRCTKCGGKGHWLTECVLAPDAGATAQAAPVPPAAQPVQRPPSTGAIPKNGSRGGPTTQ